MDGLFKILCLIIYLYYIDASSLLCDQTFCEEYIKDPGCTRPLEECSINNSTHNGQWLLSPTPCNCCEYCMPHYGKGEHCSLGGPGSGLSIGRCADGLTCVPHEDGDSYCQQMESKCILAQKDFDDRMARGEVGFLEMRPECDGKGKYAPYYCVLANTCFCQSEDGERIFGEVLYRGKDTTNNKKCGCSLLHEKIKKNIRPGVDLPVSGPRCTSDGNFNPVQCIDRVCFCVDPITGLMEQNERVDLNEKPISELSCYDATLDIYPNNVGEPPYNYTTPCLQALDTRIALIVESQKQGFNVDYFSSYTECEPDGTQGRIAKKISGEKMCVDDRGVQIGNYEASPDSPQYETMDCKCAETQLVMSSSIEKPVCCKNGNFRAIQCRRGLCYCVDSDGRQISKEISDVTKLPCYKQDWRNC